ncbi:MAG TPA: TIGR04282 family arsenosugar biosynthesis glycosyltransferase [Hyphomicrobiaceae bacterium]|nr:TIGR04282 family arsenosugar biosynthesis glycosyltransferase [Hyphomicrobiaceae bacterium]
MRPVAIGIFCKTPSAGLSKTRLSPPLRPEECSALSACFIRDLAATVHSVAASLAGTAAPYAVYTPVGTEEALQALLPSGFALLPQSDQPFGDRLLRATRDLLDAGHAGAILLNADSPTLPASILRAAVQAVRAGDHVVLGPAIDGGYTLIGLSRPHARLFQDIPWSTPQVYPLTVERAAEIGLPVVNLPCWYDVDDRQTLRLLEAELAGERVPFAQAGLVGSDAPATRAFLARRYQPLEKAS